ncbi:MAG: ribonuclease D [Luminiphilus sp.]|nr:ribonuclease D [Luminiphilus sp.]
MLEPSDTPCQWVRDTQALNAMAALISQENFVAVDTEFRRRDTFYPEVALIQLAAAGQCWLIDPLTLVETESLQALFRQNDLVKVLHSASEDLEVFERWLGVLPRPMIDTQKTAAMLGLGFGLSYRDLVQDLLSIDIAKDETQSDWLVRPLTDAQCHYAMQDVTFLAQCWPILEARAKASGYLPWILEESAGMVTGGRGPLAKFKSAWKLNSQQLAVLLGLIEWRESQARRRDRPRNWILHDKVILDLAKKIPTSLPQFASAEGMPAGVVRREGKQLMSLIEGASERGLSDPPVPLPAPANSRVRKLAKSLAPAMAVLASELGMNVEILMPSRELEMLASFATGDEGLPRPAHWQGWRKAAVIQPLELEAQRLLGEHHNVG